MRRDEKKDHLIETAARLFNARGYTATGVDQVIAESGIAKTTLYRHFGSKEDLIVAVLRRIDERFRDDMRRFVEAKSSDPCERLLATFDFLEAWFRDERFHGCPFVSAAGEHAPRGNPVFQEAMVHKRLVKAYFEDLARAAGLADPKRIAEEINLLHEGAVAVAHVTGDPEAARTAKETAARLIA